MRIEGSHYQQLQAEFQNDIDQINADFKELGKYKTPSDLLKHQDLVKRLVAEINRISNLLFQIYQSKDPEDMQVAQSPNFLSIKNYFDSASSKMDSIFWLANALSKNPEDQILQDHFASALITRVTSGDWDHFLGMAQTYIDNPLSSGSSQGDSFSYRLWEMLRGFLDLDDPSDSDFTLLKAFLNGEDLENNPLFNRLMNDLGVMYNYYLLIKGSKNPEDQKIFQDPVFQKMENFIQQKVPGSGGLSLGELIHDYQLSPNDQTKKSIANFLIEQNKNGSWTELGNDIKAFINKYPFQ